MFEWFPMSPQSFLFSFNLSSLALSTSIVFFTLSIWVFQCAHLFSSNLLYFIFKIPFKFTLSLSTLSIVYFWLRRVSLIFQFFFLHKVSLCHNVSFTPQKLTHNVEHVFALCVSKRTELKLAYFQIFWTQKWTYWHGIIAERYYIFSFLASFFTAF